MQSKKELEEVLKKAKSRVELCPTLRLHLEAKVWRGRLGGRERRVGGERGRGREGGSESNGVRES